MGIVYHISNTKTIKTAYTSVKGIDLCDPYLSPAFGDYTGFKEVRQFIERIRTESESNRT